MFKCCTGNYCADIFKFSSLLTSGEFAYERTVRRIPGWAGSHMTLLINMSRDDVLIVTCAEESGDLHVTDRSNNSVHVWGGIQQSPQILFEHQRERERERERERMRGTGGS